MTDLSVEVTQKSRVERFRALHDGGEVLILANAWDAASARLAEAEGARAVATTSAGVAWSLGAPDGERLDRDVAVAAIARIAAAVEVPVTSDIEGGYAATPAGVAETVAMAMAAGAAGVNIEDADHDGAGRLRDVAEQAKRIAAARQSADAAEVPLFVNARIDTYLAGSGGPAARLDETVTRAGAYVAAGADGIFVPGVVDPVTISALVERVAVPLNVMAGPGAPDVRTLAGLGVRRVSVGSAVAQAAYALARRGYRALLTTGGYASLSDALDYGELNALMA